MPNGGRGRSQGSLRRVLPLVLLATVSAGCGSGVPSGAPAERARPTRLATGQVDGAAAGPHRLGTSFATVGGPRTRRSPAGQPSRHPSARGDSPSEQVTVRWRMTRPAMDGEIEGYADVVGGPPGTPVALRVSTSDASYRVRAFRFGNYVGGSARLVWSSPKLRGAQQRPARFAPYETRTVVAPWHDSTRVDTTGWEPGAYLFQFTSRAGWQAVTPYVVTSTSADGTVALVAPVTTWQAYNRWGGYSLYHGSAGDQRAWAVSFDRPYDAPGFGEFGVTVAPVVAQAEKVGVPLSYFTNIDLHADPHLLDGALGYVSTGHDEYWTPAMRRTVERARGRGTNLAFLAANTAYWRIRLGSTGTGPNRLQTGYRHDAHLDRGRGVEPSTTTGRYRDRPGARPEHSLVGMLYECFPVDADYRIVTPRWWGFAGTGVRRGTELRHLVGNEADRVYPIPGTPRPLQILASDAYTCGGTPTSGQSTYYTTESGAGVFASGTLRWTCTLTGNCYGLEMDPAAVRFVERVTSNLVAGFARGPTGRRFPARHNVADFTLPAYNTVPAS